jgi:hypothetical protein
MTKRKPITAGSFGNPGERHENVREEERWS